MIKYSLGDQGVYTVECYHAISREQYRRAFFKSAPSNDFPHHKTADQRKCQPIVTTLVASVKTATFEDLFLSE